MQFAADLLVLRPLAADGKGAEKPTIEAQRFRIASPACESIREASGAAECSIPITLFSALAVLLGRYSDKEVVLRVSTDAGTRAESAKPESSATNNPKIFPITLLIEFPEGSSFRELQARLQGRYSAATANAAMLFAQSEVSGDLRGESGAFAKVSPNGAASSSNLPQAATAQDLTIAFEERGTEIDAVVRYPSQFDAETIRRFWGHYTTLLDAAIQNPGEDISTLPLLTANEFRQVLINWNDTAVDFSDRSRGLHELIEK